MSQSKHSASAAVRGRARTPGRKVQAKPAVDNRAARGKVRPLGHELVDVDFRNAGDRASRKGFAGKQLADKQEASCAQSYLQWAAFAAGTQDGDFGFGAYFADAGSAPPTRYTWSTSRRR
jgi:hypothetical protein